MGREVQLRVMGNKKFENVNLIFMLYQRPIRFNSNLGKTQRGILGIRLDLT